MAFAILTDSASNITAALARERDIVVIPFPYFCDGKPCHCLDFDAFDEVDYYGRIKNGMTVTTSQINPQQYIDYMEPLLQEGRDLLFAGISGGISGSFASALIAAEELREKYPQRNIRLVDTQGASLGEGLLVLRAAMCRANGMELDEVADRLEKLKKCIYQVFVVDDLNHLRRTGRLSNLGAVVGTVLGIRPLLKGNGEGKIVAMSKHRGKKAAIKALADKYAALVRNNQVIGISHCNSPEDAQTLCTMLKALPNGPKEILLVKHEPATGSHLGPGSLALYFEGDEHVRDC